METEVQRVRDAVAPVLSAHRLELYDIEVHRTMVRVIVDRPDGVGLDDLGQVTPAVSRALDDADPIAQRYTLEVTSPGVERPLRTPDQFARAVGETVTVKTIDPVDGRRRLQGVLTSADDMGITVRVDEPSASDSDKVTRAVAYRDIARARTVFHWGEGGEQKRERRS